MTGVDVAGLAVLANALKRMEGYRGELLLSGRQPLSKSSFELSAERRLSVSLRSGRARLVAVSAQAGDGNATPPVI